MIINEMSGAEFEDFVAAAMRHQGYQVETTPVSGDFGVDLVARKGSECVAVQCKRQFTPVGPGAVQQVVAGAVMYDCTSTMVVSNASFTAGAVALAKRHDCALVGGMELRKLAANWQPDFDLSKSRALQRHTRQPRVRSAELQWEALMFKRLSPSARDAVLHATAVASEFDADVVRPEHLFLGTVGSANGGLSRLLSGYGLTADSVREQLIAADVSIEETFDDDVVLLRSIGIDLLAIRDRLDDTFGAAAFDNALRSSGRRRRRRARMPFTKSAKGVFDEALREALARNATSVDCEHVLLGILIAGDAFTLGLITSHVDAIHLRSAIVECLDQAA